MPSRPSTPDVKPADGSSPASPNARRTGDGHDSSKAPATPASGGQGVGEGELCPPGPAEVLAHTSPPPASPAAEVATKTIAVPAPDEFKEEASHLEGEDEPFTAVSLGEDPITPDTASRFSAAESPFHTSNLPSSSSTPASPSFAEPLASRPKGDRSSFLLSHAARQSETRLSVDGASKLREDFERLRASHNGSASVGQHAEAAPNGDGAGGSGSARSSVQHRAGAARARRTSSQSRTSRRSLAASDGANGHDAGGHGSAIQEGEEAGSGSAGDGASLVDEPLGPPGEGSADVDDEDVDWAFWGAVMADYQKVAREDQARLGQAIQAGIPAVIRGQIWQLMSSSKDVELETLYSSLLHQASPHEKAIQKDLTRTFPAHKFFQRPQAADGQELAERGRGQDELFNVVKAYSLYDPDVGYVQGSAFIVASLLLNMPDEEAFCVWVRLMHSYGLRTSFLPEMPGLQLRLFQFDRLVEDLIPLLHVHFLRNGVKSSMYAGQWFLTLFSYRFPLDCVYRIFDAIFAEGIEAVFRFSVALLLKNEEQLLKLGFEDIMKYLQTSLFDSYKVSPPEGDYGAPLTDETEEEWLSSDFVRDSFAVRITPFQLDGYTAEWDELCRAQNAHAVEVDVLRTANRQLSGQVKQLEASLATLNTEHCAVVKELVLAKVAREEMEEELVRYKMMYAELSHQSAESKQRSSGTSFWGLGRSGSKEP